MGRGGGVGDAVRGIRVSVHMCVVCVGGWMCASVHCVRDVGVCEWSVCVYVCVYVCVCMCGCMCVCWQEGEGC